MTPALNDEWAISVMFRNGESGGRRFNRISWLIPDGSWARTWGLALSYTRKTGSSAGNIFSHSRAVSARNSSYLSLMTVSKAIRWCTRPISPETANVTLQLRPRCACTTRLPRMPRGALPKDRLVHYVVASFVNEHAVADNSVLHEPLRVLYTHIKYPWRVAGIRYVLCKFKGHEHAVQGSSYGAGRHGWLVWQRTLELIFHLSES